MCEERQQLAPRVIKAEEDFHAYAIAMNSYSVALTLLSPAVSDMKKGPNTQSNTRAQASGVHKKDSISAVYNLEKDIPKF